MLEGDHGLTVIEARPPAIARVTVASEPDYSGGPGTFVGYVTVRCAPWLTATKAQAFGQIYARNLT